MASPPRARSKAGPTKQARSQAWQAWRIADGRFDPFSPIGASLVGGRWNSPGLGVIYASRSYAGAMLECLAHAGIGRMPRTHVAIEIAIAAAVSVEGHDDSSLPAGWDHADLAWPGPSAMPGFASGERPCWWFPRSLRAGKGTCF
jgi:RES domain-containing protein